MFGLHLTFSTCGFWPPNDPRGSWSKIVRSQTLYEVGGPPTTIPTRYSLANRPHDQNLRQAIKDEYKFPPVRFTGVQAHAVGHGIGAIAAKIKLAIFALSILPDHVHLVTAQHQFAPEELIACLQRAATRELNHQNQHPLKDHAHPNGKSPSPWAKGGWKVYLDTVEAMQRTIRYVEMNPIKDGKPKQHWSCVVPYEP